ncbi:hypothetical protein [Pararobbsia silviterrae]|nr:hypothetical protein [Pararobbsia silviterrae]
MNTLKTATARLAQLTPQGRLRWLKLSVYGLVFLLPFGMAMLALLVYLERRSRVAGADSGVEPSASAPSSAKPRRAALPHYCSNRP